MIPGWVTLILAFNQAVFLESGCSENMKANSLDVFYEEHKELRCISGFFTCISTLLVKYTLYSK